MTMRETQNDERQSESSTSAQDRPDLERTPSRSCRDAEGIGRCSAERSRRCKELVDSPEANARSSTGESTWTRHAASRSSD